MALVGFEEASCVLSVRQFEVVQNGLVCAADKFTDCRVGDKVAEYTLDVHAHIRLAPYWIPPFKAAP